MSTPVAPAPSLDAYIVRTPEVLGGKPRIAGTRVAVTHVKTARLALGMSFEEIAESFNLPLAAVYAAMAYYYTHKAEIDQQDAEDARYIEAFKRHNSSPLEAKLAQLKQADVGRGALSPG